MPQLKGAAGGMRTLYRVFTIPDGSIDPNTINQQVHMVMLSVRVAGNQELVLVVDAQFMHEVAGHFRPFVIAQFFGRWQ